MSCNTKASNTNPLPYYFVETPSENAYDSCKDHSGLLDDEAKPLLSNIDTKDEPASRYNACFGPLLGGSEKLMEFASNLFAEKKK